MFFRTLLLVMLFAAGGAIAAGPWIEGVTARATSAQFHKAKNVVSDGGLAETPAGMRFVCDANHRPGGNPDASGLGKMRFFAGERAVALPDESGAIPADAGGINVRKPPYSAKGDGVTADTEALQRALLDWQGSRRATHGGETRELPREGTPSLTLFRSETK